MGGDSKIHIKPSIRDIRFRDTGFGDIRFGIVMVFKVWDVQIVWFDMILPGGPTCLFLRKFLLGFQTLHL